MLPYITWGLVWDPQNKRGIPEKNINIIYSRRKFKKKDIEFIKYTDEENTKKRRKVRK